MEMMTSMGTVKVGDNEYYHSDKNNIVFANEPVKTPKGRFVSVFLSKKKPGKVFDGKKSEDKHEVTILLKKDDEKVKALYKKLQTMCKEMVEIYNEKADAELGKIKKIFFDGDESDTEKYPHDKGCWKLRATGKDLPDICDKDGDDLDATAISGGHLGRLVVKPKVHSKGFSFGLELVKFLEDDGLKIGGGKPDYRALAAEDDEEEENDKESDDDSGDDGSGVGEVSEDEDEDEEDESDDEEEEESEEKEDDDDEEEEAPKKVAKNGNGKATVKVQLSAKDKAKADAEARVVAKKTAVKNAGKGKAAGVALL